MQITIDEFVDVILKSYQNGEKITFTETRTILIKVMQSLDNLTASIGALSTTVTGLTASVDAAVTELNSQGPTDAQLAALQQTVDGLNAAIAAQTERLNAAVGTAATV